MADSRRRYLIAAGAILLGSLVVRMVCHVGLVSFEPVFTAWSAHDVLQGTYVPQQHVPGSINNSRFGMVLPTAAAAGLLGFGDASCTVWPMACGMLLLLGVLVLGPGVIGERASLPAAGVLAVVPCDVLYAGQLYSDLPMSAAWTWAALLFWRALSTGSKGRAITAGLVAGLSWWIREPGPLILAVLLLWSWRAGAVRLWLLAAAAALAVLLIDLAFYTWTTGDPLFRFEIMTRGIHARYMSEDYYTGPGAVLTRVFLEIPAMLAWPGNEAFPYYAALPLAALGAALAGGRALWKAPALRRLGLWFGLVFAAFAFLPVSIVPFRPAMYLMPRTLIPFMVPSALVLGVALGRWKWGLAGAGVVAACSLVFLAVLTPRLRAGWPETREAIAVLEREGARVIVTDEVISMTSARANFISVHRQFDPDLRVYSWRVRADLDHRPESAEYLLVHSGHVSDIADPAYDDLRVLMKHPDPGWQLLFRREFTRPGDDRVHHVAVYRISAGR